MKFSVKARTYRTSSKLRKASSNDRLEHSRVQAAGALIFMETSNLPVQQRHRHSRSVSTHCHL